MDSIEALKAATKQVLLAHARVPFSYGEIECKPVFDDERGSYLLSLVGWHDKKRIHGILCQIDLIGEKLWVQYDGTEEGIAIELVEAGVRKDQIVLGFKPPAIRPHTGFAAA